MTSEFNQPISAPLMQDVAPTFARLVDANDGSRGRLQPMIAPAFWWVLRNRVTWTPITSASNNLIAADLESEEFTMPKGFRRRSVTNTMAYAVEASAAKDFMTTVEVFEAEVSEFEDSQWSGTNALPGSDFASARFRQRSASAQPFAGLEDT